MWCNKIQKMLSSYLDGELESAEKFLVSSHLSFCATCRAELEELRVAMELIHQLPELSPPQKLHEQIREKLDSLSPTRRKQRSILMTLAPNTFWTKAAAAAVILLIFGIASLWYGLAGPHQIREKHESVALKGSGQVPSPPESLQTGHVKEEHSIRSSKEKGVSEKKAADSNAEQGGFTAPPSPGTDTYRPAALSPPESVPHRNGLTNQPKGVSVTTNSSEMAVENKNILQSAKIPRIIQRIVLIIETENPEEMADQISSLSEQKGRVTISKNGTLSLTIQVPPKEESSILEKIESIGKILDRKRQELDITADYYNTSAHLQSLQQKEKDLLTKYPEHEAPPPELEKIRQEIKQTRDHLDVLEHELNIVTIQVELH